MKTHMMTPLTLKPKIRLTHSQIIEKMKKLADKSGDSASFHGEISMLELFTDILIYKNVNFYQPGIEL